MRCPATKTRSREVKDTRTDNRPDHEPILPASLSERDLRSMIRSITRSIQKTRNGAMILKLRQEQERLRTELNIVRELKRKKLEARLAEIEAAKESDTQFS